jgi:hypothetical protein
MCGRMGVYTKRPTPTADAIAIRPPTAIASGPRESDPFNVLALDDIPEQS